MLVPPILWAPSTRRTRHEIQCFGASYNTPAASVWASLSNVLTQPCHQMTRYGSEASTAWHGAFLTHLVWEQRASGLPWTVVDETVSCGCKKLYFKKMMATRNLMFGWRPEVEVFGQHLAMRLQIGPRLHQHLELFVEATWVGEAYMSLDLCAVFALWAELKKTMFMCVHHIKFLSVLLFFSQHYNHNFHWFPLCLETLYARSCETYTINAEDSSSNDKVGFDNSSNAVWLRQAGTLTGREGMICQNALTVPAYVDVLFLKH